MPRATTKTASLADGSTLASTRVSMPARATIDGLAYAWINRHLRACDYIRATGRSPQNTTRDLQRAVDDGWLTSAGERRARIYALGPKLLEIPAFGEIAPVPTRR